MLMASLWSLQSTPVLVHICCVWQFVEAIDQSQVLYYNHVLELFVNLSGVQYSFRRNCEIYREPTVMWLLIRCFAAQISEFKFLSGEPYVLVHGVVWIINLYLFHHYCWRGNQTIHDCILYALPICSNTQFLLCRSSTTGKHARALHLG
jgi:hypothetical protein